MWLDAVFLVCVLFGIRSPSRMHGLMSSVSSGNSDITSVQIPAPCLLFPLQAPTTPRPVLCTPLPPGFPIYCFFFSLLFQPGIRFPPAFEVTDPFSSCA